MVEGEGRKMHQEGTTKDNGQPGREQWRRLHGHIRIWYRRSIDSSALLSAPKQPEPERRQHMLVAKRLD